MVEKTALKGRGKVEKVMYEYKEGELKSGSGQKITNRKQAVAVALSEARRAGPKSPRRNRRKDRPRVQP
jgi:hypothetical protein